MAKPVYSHARFNGQVGFHEGDDWMKNYDLIIILKEKLNKTCFPRVLSLCFFGGGVGPGSFYVIQAGMELTV